MCWTKKLVCFFLSVAVRRRRHPPASRRCATRASARAAREARGCLEGEEYPHPAKMKRDCFFACKYISDDTQFTKHKVDKEHKPQYCQQVP